MEKIAQSIPDHDSIPRLQELTEKVHDLNGLRGERLNEAKSLVGGLLVSCVFAMYGDIFWGVYF